LGIIAMFEPCTAYTIHKEFIESPSMFFSGSAGAIYPAVERLERQKLVKGERAGTKAKPSSVYYLTALGRQEYSRWFTDPLRAVDAGFDPLRNRVSMLESFPTRLRQAIFSDLQKFAEQRKKIVNDLVKKLPERSPMRFATEMELATLEAKLELLRTWQKYSERPHHHLL